MNRDCSKPAFAEGKHSSITHPFGESVIRKELGRRGKQHCREFTLRETLGM